MTYSLKNKVLLLNMFIPFLMGIGIDLYAPSLPAIAQHFHTSNRLVQMTIGLYLLGYAIGQIVLGVVSDSIGRRKVLLLSACLYTVVSFMAVASPSIYILNTCRLLQGIGIAGLACVFRAVNTDCFTGIELTKALNTTTIFWAMGPIIGPAIGGYLQHYFNWHANFYLFCSFGLLIFIYTACCIPETNLRPVPLQPKNTWRTITMIASHPIFLYATAVAALIYSILIVFHMVGPFLIQVVLNYSAVQYGHIALMLGFAYFLGGVCNRLLLPYLDPMTIVYRSILGAFGMSVCMLGLGLIFPIRLWIILIPALLLFYFCGFVFSNVASQCLRLFPNTAGTASALFGTVQVAGVFVIAAAAILLETSSQIPMAIAYVGILLTCLMLVPRLRGPQISSA